MPVAHIDILAVTPRRFAKTLKMVAGELFHQRARRLEAEMIWLTYWTYDHKAGKSSSSSWLS